MEVVASLSRRNQFAPEKSLALWLAHVTEAERNSRGLPRATLSYDTLLADPADALGRVHDDAAFPMKSTAAQRKAAADHIRPELRRQLHGGPNAPLRGAMASGLDLALDAGYSRIAELPAGRDPRSAVDAMAAAALPALAAAVPPWVAEELAAAQAVGQRRALEVDAARRRIDDLANQVEAARTADAARGSETAALRACVDELAAARRELAEASDVRAAVSAERKEIETERAALRAARDGHEATLQACADQLAAARRELAGIGEARRAAIAEVDSARAAELEQREHADRLQRELGDERAAIARLSEQIDEARAVAHAGEAQIELANRHLHDLVAELESTRHAHAVQEAREAVLYRELDAARQDIAALAAERRTLRAECDDAGARLALLSIETETLRRDLAALDSRHRPLVETARQTQQAAAELAAELERRAAAEGELSADRAHLAQLEREARERIAMIEGRLTELDRRDAGADRQARHGERGTRSARRALARPVGEALRAARLIVVRRAVAPRGTQARVDAGNDIDQARTITRSPRSCRLQIANYRRSAPAVEFHATR